MLNDEAIALLALTPNRREVPLLRHLEHDIDLAAAASNPARKSKGKSSSTAGIERTLNRPVDDHLALLTTWPSCTSMCLSFGIRYSCRWSSRSVTSWRA